jgi:hypothetical protein
MGSHANYFRIIKYLINLKDEFHRIDKERFQPSIKELNNYEIYPHSDNDHLPDNKQLAAKLKYSQYKMNIILKDLLKELVVEFHNSPLVIKKYVHQFLIHIPWDEERDIPNKKFVEESRKQSIYIEMILPVTPRIGEEVTIPLLEETGKFYRGYVHEIKHNITGSTQEILLFVHPWNSYYYKWLKMKDEFERNKSWKDTLKNM